MYIFHYLFYFLILLVIKFQISLKYYQKTTNEEELSPDEIISTAQAQKQQANTLVQARDFKNAILLYNKVWLGLFSPPPLSLSLSPSLPSSPHLPFQFFSFSRDRPVSPHRSFGYKHPLSFTIPPHNSLLMLCFCFPALFLFSLFSVSFLYLFFLFLFLYLFFSFLFFFRL